MSSQRRALRVHLGRLLDSLSLIALHEADALNAHFNAAGERLRLARQARGLHELWRDQVDLLPESRNRLRDDHAIRRRLWSGLARDLKLSAVRLRRRAGTGA